MTEARVLHDCLAYLGSFPHILVLRINSGAFRDHTGRLVRTVSANGVADILGVIGPIGRGLAVECKSDSGRLTEAQTKFRDAWLKRNGLWILARSVDDLRKAGIGSVY